MTAAFRGCETVVMISAPVAGSDDRVLLHRHVIAAARDAGVRRVLFTSIASETDERSFYFPTQQINRTTEADLRASGLDWTILRNALYLDLDLRHILAAGQSDGLYVNPGASGRASYLTIDELAYATACSALASGHEGQTWNLTGECLTQQAILSHVNAVFGLAVRYESISDEASIRRFETLMPERGPAVARMLTGCFQSMRLGHFELPSHFEQAAGRPPRSVRQMLEDCRARL